MPYCAQCGALLVNGICPNCSKSEPDTAQPETPAAQIQTPADQARANARGKQTRNKSRNGALSKVPRPVGIVWDILLLIILIFFEYNAISLIVNPADVFAGMSVPARIVANEAIVLGIALPILFLICDRRPLRRFIKPLVNSSFLTELIVCFVWFILWMIIYAVCFVGLQ